MSLVEAVAKYLRSKSILEGTKILTLPYEGSRNRKRPIPYIVLTQAGRVETVGSRSFVPFDGITIDFQCYGLTLRECRIEAHKVHRAMQALDNEQHDGVHLTSSEDLAGPLDGVEPTTSWPFTLISKSVYYEESTLLEGSVS